MKRLSWGFVGDKQVKICKQGGLIQYQKQLKQFQPKNVAKNGIRIKKIVVRSSSNYNPENPMLTKIVGMFLRECLKPENDVREYQDLYNTLQNLCDMYEPKISGSNFTENLHQDFKDIDSEKLQKFEQQIFEFLKAKLSGEKYVFDAKQDFDDGENFGVEIDKEIKVGPLNENLNQNIKEENEQGLDFYENQNQNIHQENEQYFEGDKLYQEMLKKFEEKLKKIEILEEKLEENVNFLQQFYSDQNKPKNSSSASVETTDYQKKLINEFIDLKLQILQSPVEIKIKLNEILNKLQEKKMDDESQNEQLNEISESINQIKQNLLHENSQKTFIKALQNILQKKKQQQNIENTKNEESKFNLQDLFELNLESVDPILGAKKDVAFQIILKNRSEKNPVTLEMFIPKFSGQQLQKILNGKNNEKRVIYNVFQIIIEKFEQKLEKMVIIDVQNGVYVSNLEFRNLNGEIWYVEMRPSDALNLALRFRAPIYIHKKIIDK